jgi:hypothetical protein
MIVCAAIKLVMRPNLDEELVVCGHRHSDCFKVIHNLERCWRENTLKIQGFIDHRGQFLTRAKAFAHAYECGQISATAQWYHEDHNQTELYSEDLY